MTGARFYETGLSRSVSTSNEKLSNSVPIRYLVHDHFDDLEATGASITTLNKELKRKY